MNTIAEVSTGGVSGIVQQLTTGVTKDTIFTVVGEVMPFVIQMIPICLGLYILRKVVKGAGHAKVRF